MENIQNKFPLYSYNKWRKLGEVTVGRPFPDKKLFIEYSFCHFNSDNVNEHLDIVKTEEITDKEHMSNIKLSICRNKKRILTGWSVLWRKTE